MLVPCGSTWLRSSGLVLQLAAPTVLHACTCCMQRQAGTQPDQISLLYSSCYELVQYGAAAHSMALPRGPAISDIGGYLDLDLTDDIVD
jgi:hypothetical protein